MTQTDNEENVPKGDALESAAGPEPAGQTPSSQPQPQPLPRLQQPHQAVPPHPHRRGVFGGSDFSDRGAQASRQQTAPEWGSAPQPQRPFQPTVQYVPMQPQAKSRGWIVALVAVVLMFLLAVMGMRSCTSLLSSPMGYSSSASAADTLTRDAVAVITLDGTIQYDGTSCSPEGFKALLDQAEANDHIKAVVLRVNSGGGDATAGEEMTEYLRQFDKPVVISSGSLNASAAYLISSQADYIFAAKTSLVGSIGAIIQITDISQLMDRLGINNQDIASSQGKDASSGNRPLTDDERSQYQHIVDQAAEIMVDYISKGRGMNAEDVHALANGMGYTGLDAVDNGLVDEIGTREDAVAKAAELAGMSGYTVVDLDLDSDDLSEMLSLL